MWRLTTVPVSSQAWMNGSQWPECRDGRPSLLGSSLNGDGLEPALGVRADHRPRRPRGRAATGSGRG